MMCRGPEQNVGIATGVTSFATQRRHKKEGATIRSTAGRGEALAAYHTPGTTYPDAIETTDHGKDTGKHSTSR